MELVYDKDGVKKYHLTINSADRNQLKFPEPQEYNIDLPETLYGVVSIELIEGSIPNTQYVVDNFNNTFTVVDAGGTSITATISRGDYRNLPGVLAAGIKDALDTATTIILPGTTSKVGYSSNNSRFFITHNAAGNPYTMVMNQFDSPSYMLGAANGTFRVLPSNTALTVSSNYHVTTTSTFFPHRFHISGVDNILLKLKCNNEIVGDIQRAGTTNLQDNCGIFANIALTSDPGAFTYYTRNTFYPNKYCFTKGPLNNLKTLGISFWNDYKQRLSPYNFNGIEHTLKFEIVAHLDKSWSRARINKCYNC